MLDKNELYAMKDHSIVLSTVIGFILGIILLIILWVLFFYPTQRIISDEMVENIFVIYYPFESLTNIIRKEFGIREDSIFVLILYSGLVVVIPTTFGFIAGWIYKKVLK